MVRRGLSLSLIGRGLWALLGLLQAVLWLALPAAGASVPAAPTFLRSVATSNSAVSLFWEDNSTDEANFGISVTDNGTGPQYYKVPTSSGTGMGDDGRTFPSFFLPNHTYLVAVCGLNSNNEPGGYTNTITVKTGDFNPPTSLVATTLGDGTIVLTWSDNAFFEAGYFVEYRELPNGAWTRDGSSGADNCVAPLNHSTWMIPSRSYEFRVQAFQGTADAVTGTTAFSPTATASLPNLVAPTNLTVTPSSTAPNQISFAWSDNSTMEHAYELEYRKQNLASPQPFALLRTVAANVTSLANLPAFEPGTVYEFRLRAAFYASASETIGSAYYPASGGIAATTRNGIKSKPYAPLALGEPFSTMIETQSLSPRTSLDVGPLPAGLSFNSQSGVISGTIQTPGVYTIPITAHFADGSSHSQPLTLRVVCPPAAPKIVAPIPAQTMTQWGAATFWLTSSFADPDTEQAVRVHTSKGNLDFILYPSATPQTVANFLQYASAYAGSLFHRSEAGFVLQGGGYYYYGNNLFMHLPTAAAVPNEPGLSNGPGTVAMAKIADQPDSAASEFFINLGDNSANLDNQNGGFTVFGRLSTPSLPVLSTLAAIPYYTETISLYDSSSQKTVKQSWSNLPIDGDGIPWVTSVENISSPLTYSLVTPPDSAVATATLNNGLVQISPVASGSTQIIVAATDLDGNTTSQTIPITVEKTYNEWASEQGVSYSEPTAPRPDGLTNLHAFAFMANPAHGVPASLPTLALKTSDPTPRARITFPVRKYTTGLTYVVEASNTLGANDWTTLWTSTDGLDVPNVSAKQDQADRTVITIDDTQPAASSSRRFLRVRLVTP